MTVLTFLGFRHSVTHIPQCGEDSYEPFSGFRVLDLTRFLSGPYCTMVLAELGADVIKVEQPGTGDDSRRMGPKINGESYPFAMPNRSKRAVAVDLKADRGRELFLKLAARRTS